MSGFEVEYEGRVVGMNTDANEAAAKSEIEALGFGNHGIVIRTAGGEVLFKQPDHDVNVDDVRAKLDELVN